VLPLEGVKSAGDIVVLLVSLLALVALIAYQAGAIMRADYPGLRAVEALAFTASLLLFVFSVTYDVMDAESSAAFGAVLSRLDCLYFTVTVFGTVGFGDITAHSETARAIVTVQMLFDFLFVGVAVRVITGAVEIGRRRAAGK
jgi:predicted membrane channel-forming protein YqfA (hemolysin III family)